jgi:CBS domain-containing protein
MRTVDELMSGDVVTVPLHETVTAARRTMLRHHVHALPVVDGDGALVGMITSSHLVDRWPAETLVQHAMVPDPPTIGPHTTIADAAQILVDHHLHHVVVVDRSGIVGMVSTWDFLRCLLRDPLPIVPTPETKPGLHAAPGDVIVVRPALVGGHDRRATVLEASGPDNTAPFVVRWADDPHDVPRRTLFFPGSDAYVEHKPAEAPTAGSSTPT